MTSLDALFLIPLFIIGGICSFTDIKYGKIKNKWVKLGLVWTGLLYLSLIFYTIFYTHRGENLGYILEMLINGLIALGVGYFLWQFKLWSAGDAKLFTLYAFLVPLKFYSNYYIAYFPSFILLANAFMLIIIFLIGEALLFTIKNRPKITSLPWGQWLKPENLKPKIINTAKTYLNYIIILIGLRWGMQALSRAFGQEMGSNFPLLFLIFFFARRYLFRFILKNKKVVSALGIFTGAYTFYLISQGQAASLFGILKIAFIFMVTIGLLMKFLSLYVEKKEVSKTFPFALFMLAACFATLAVKGFLLSPILSLFY